MGISAGRRRGSAREGRRWPLSISHPARLLRRVRCRATLTRLVQDTPQNRRRPLREVSAKTVPHPSRAGPPTRGAGTTTQRHHPPSRRRRQGPAHQRRARGRWRVGSLRGSTGSAFAGAQPRSRRNRVDGESVGEVSWRQLRDQLPPKWHHGPASKKETAVITGTETQNANGRSGSAREWKVWTITCNG